MDIAIASRAIGAGAHGAVFAAFEPTTGEARTVKRLVIRNLSTVDEIKKEVEALRYSRDQFGIVRTYGFRNRDMKTSIPTSFPADFFIIMERGILYTIFRNWTNLGP